ncbi:MAG: mucoidy inhibitor MuiA family protein, partial [Bacteroidota bacterium]|nr:mucoidy inhibitor MuiA family protein [Bacteroidota bacterium]
MRIFLFSLMLLSSFPSNSQVRKLDAETTIQQVTIFSSGARIERTASVNIQSGRSEISFGGLSNQLDLQTVQLKADANITLLSVQASRDYLTQRKIEKQEQEYIDHIKALKEKIDMDQKMLEVYKNEETMLIKNQAIGGDAGVKTTDLKAALEFQRQQLTEIYTRELEVQKRLASEDQDLKRNTTQLQVFSKKKDSVNYIVTALIESKETSTVNFQLFYNVKDAGWYPGYDVRVTEINKPLNILMNANIFQRSGETWKNIPLLLSTGNPGDNATPSQLQPWMLGFYDASVSFRASVAQGEISGRVTNNQGEPLQNCSVRVKNSQMVASTDVNGFFKIQNISRHSILDFTCVGYEQKEISTAPGYIAIVLTQSSTSLNDVVVVGYG